MFTLASVSCYGAVGPVLQSPEIHSFHGGELLLRQEFPGDYWSNQRRVAPGLLQVFRGHGQPDGNVSVEGEKPRFAPGRDLGRFGQVNDQDGASPPVLLREINGLGLGVLQNSADFLSNRAIFDGLVECLRWKVNI